MVLLTSRAGNQSALGSKAHLSWTSQAAVGTELAPVTLREGSLLSGHRCRRAALALRAARAGFPRKAHAAAEGGVTSGSVMSIEEYKKEYEFKIVKEELRYSRYINVFNRVVEYPPHPSRPEAKSQQERTVEYDVVGSKTKSNHFVAVVPFHSATKTVTLLSEYAQGANHIVYGVPCGGLSPNHTSLEHCATRELSEEAFLKGGKLVRLLDDKHPGLLEVKWCRNRFTPFLVIDPEPDTTPHPRDAEEFIEVHQIGVPALRALMYGGDMMLPSIVSCNMALDYLREQGLL